MEDKQQNEDGTYTYTLRSQYNSVDVDTLVYAVSDKDYNLGEFYKVKITSQNGIDLVGNII